MSGRIRLDLLLTQRGLAPSREKAQAAVLAGLVKVDGARIDKAGALVRTDAEIAIEQTARFVGRGGEKLDGALDELGIDVSGARVLDVGASTGGFTDCILQRGAARGVALDVGRGQLDWKLRNDPRVQVVEGVNVRYLDPASIPAPFDLVVVDVSFISLRLVLPVLFPLLPPASREGLDRRQGPESVAGHAERGKRGSGLLEPGAKQRESASVSASSSLELPLLMALVKPQFEAGRGKVGRRGVVTDAEEQIGAIVRVGSCAPAFSLGQGVPEDRAPDQGPRTDSGSAAGPRVNLAAAGSAPGFLHPIGVLGLVESALRGAEGNREFFLVFGPGHGFDGITLEQRARAAVLGQDAQT